MGGRKVGLLETTYVTLEADETIDRLATASSNVELPLQQVSKDATSVLLHDTTMTSGVANIRAVYLVKKHDAEFQAIETEYPIPLLLRRLRQEQKTFQKGGTFALQAWSNLHKIPADCQQYIKQELEEMNNDTHFWSLLVVDPVYTDQSSWRARFLGKRPANVDAVVGVLVVFRRCSRAADNATKDSYDEAINSLAELLVRPLSEVWEDVRQR